MARPVTVKDVAEHADVSIATVSRVLNNHSSINEEMRQRVLKVASELGYTKSAKDGQLRAAKEGNPLRPAERALKEIAFLLTYSEEFDDEATIDTFWAHILHGVATEARNARISVTYLGIGGFSQSPQQLLTKLNKLHVGGILLVGGADLVTVQSIQSTYIPFVLVDNYIHIPGQQPDAVLSDNYEGTREAINYLISVGHRQIAYIGGYTTFSPQPPNKIYTIERRKEGYCAALMDAGLPVDPALMEACNITHPDGGYAACKRLIASGEPFSAVFCANDPTAIGAMKALRDAGLRIPEDVSVVGFDDIDMAEHLTPALTTVRVYKEAMGATAVKTLIARVAEPQAVNVTTILGVELVKRESVCPRSM